MLNVLKVCLSPLPSESKVTLSNFGIALLSLVPMLEQLKTSNEHRWDKAQFSLVCSSESDLQLIAINAKSLFDITWAWISQKSAPELVFWFFKGLCL